MFPGVRFTILFSALPVKLALKGVTVSVCSNPVVWLLNFHVILGTGAPTDLQEMVPLSPSGMIISGSLRAVVLASSIYVRMCSKTE